MVGRTRLLAKGTALALAAFVLGSGLLLPGLHSNTPLATPSWWRFVTLAMVCVAMALRRLAPRAGLVVGTVGFCADMLIGMSIPTAFIYTDNLYSATLRGPRWMPRFLLIASIVVSVAVGVAVYFTDTTTLAILVLALMAMITLSPVATATIVRGHRERADLERDRAATMAELAAVDRRVALTAERTRMARELHDTIANHFSAIAMRSSAVLSRPDMDAEAMRAVIAEIRGGSVAGLADMRRSIEMLRSDVDDEETVRHRLDDLDSLIPRLRSAGLRVELRVGGAPAPPPLTIEFAAYRIVQEALTNVLKHGRDAVVDIHHAPDRLSITVDNALGDGATTVPGSGHGLIGMRERATLLGGDFAAGPHGTGWRVSATLPFDKEEPG